MKKTESSEQEAWYAPKKIWEEYTAGVNYKNALGSKGLYEQNRINERFYAGDQWHGAQVGSDRPLARYNVIRRIGDYKQAVIGAAPVTVNYSAEGVPNTLDLQESVRKIRDLASMNSGGDLSSLLSSAGVQSTEGEDIPTGEEINLVMSAMSDYFRTTAERLQLDDKKDRVLRNAYNSGTGVLYTYWDETVNTGLYADASRKTPVKGDIRCEVLDIENVYFGDPNRDDIQDQPFILIAQRKSVEELKREAKANKRPQEEIDEIVPDKDTDYMAGELAVNGEAENTTKLTVVTKFYKEYSDDGRQYTVKAVRCTAKATVREAWDTGIRLYPLAVFVWERRRNCAYGESEITYLIPNQIAINRMVTASVWAVMMMGIPNMVVNTDIVTDPVTNDPGQIIPVSGSDADVQGAIRYVNPPNFSPKFSEYVEQMISQTLTQSGANDAALGDVRPDNTSAIIAVREAATMPLQTMQNRFYTFIEDVARIWAEFWLMKYGERSLKVTENGGVWYMPFDAKRYRDLLINTKIDVGASSLWSEAQSIATLDNLFDRQVIDAVQYLTRLPKGTIPNVEGLIREMQTANAAVSAQQANASATAPPSESGVLTENDVLNELPPDVLQKLQSYPGNVQGSLVRAGMSAAQNAAGGVTGTML